MADDSVTLEVIRRTFGGQGVVKAQWTTFATRVRSAQLYCGYQKYKGREYVSVASIARAFDRMGPGMAAITLRLEDESDREAKRSAVSREVQTGDPVFDDAIYIESDASDEGVLAVLSSRDVRGAILALCRTAPGFPVLIYPDGVAISLMAGAGTAGAGILTQLPEMLAPLATIAEHVAQVARSGVLRAPKGSSAWLALQMVFVQFWCIGGIGSCAYAHDLAEPIDWYPYALSLVVGIVVTAVVGFALGPPLRAVFAGRSTSHRKIALARIFLAFPFPFLTIAGALAYNRYADDSPAEPHVTKVVGLKRDKNSQSLVVESWRTKGSTETLKLKQLDYANGATPPARSPIGTTVVVETHRGAMRWEWKEVIRALPPAKPGP
jgi:hypothetical protein